MPQRTQDIRNFFALNSIGIDSATGFYSRVGFGPSSPADKKQ
jgi:hypothetical protein